MKHFSEKRIKLFPILFVFVFSIIIFYYEILLNIFTVQEFFNINWLYALLFSFSYGGFLLLLLALIKNKTALHIVSSVLLALIPIAYLVQCFVYFQFKVFYDLQTMFGGASDALNGFSGEIFNMIFSFRGAAAIILYFVPFVVFMVFAKQIIRNIEIKLFSYIASTINIVLCYSLALLLIMTNPVSFSVYKTEYNYNSAVCSFGFMSAFRLEVKNKLFSDDNFFEPIDTPTAALPKEPEMVEYGENVMDLDLSGGTGKIAELNEYVKTLTPSKKNKYTGMFKGKNLIFISAEAFTAEVIDPDLTPTLYRLATKGIQFTDYYQPDIAGTTGGEYQNLFGMLPTAGGLSFKNTAQNFNYMTIGSQLNRLGYYGKAFHNNSYTYYSRHLTHVNIGYSDGFMGYGNGMEQFVKNRWPQSDLEMFEGTVPTFIDNQPFNVYYMTVSGHSGYSRSGNSMVAKNWQNVEHLNYSDSVKGYLAANYELERALTYLVDQLYQKGIADDTVICISSDHFPYGLDKNARLGNMPNLSELYGYPVNTVFERDHSRLILWCGELEKSEPIVVSTPTISLDILPTLSNLFGTEFDSRLFPGRDVFSDAAALVFNSSYDWKTEYGTYYASKGEFVPSVDADKIPEDYVDTMKKIVRNKIRFCAGALDNDYFRYLFDR